MDDGWTTSGRRTTRAADDADPWQTLVDLGGSGLPGGIALGADGSLQVAGLEWMGARAYDPSSRGFLSVDPVTAPAGAAWAGNPYSFAGNDPLHAIDPLGLAPSPTPSSRPTRRRSRGRSHVPQPPPVTGSRTTGSTSPVVRWSSPAGCSSPPASAVRSA